MCRITSLRGGAWGNSKPDNFRCANRNDNDPSNVNTNNGFRLVVRPSPRPDRSRRVAARGGRVGERTRPAPDRLLCTAEDEERQAGRGS